MKPPFFRVVWRERQQWWPSHEDFADETAAHQFAADTMARVGEAEVHHVGGCNAAYGQNPDRCHYSAGHAGTHSNQWGTTWTDDK